MKSVRRCARCTVEKPSRFFESRPGRAGAYLKFCDTCCTELQLENANKNKTDHRKHYNTVNGRAIALFVGAKRRAINRGLEFSIELTMIREKLLNGHCEASGIAFDFSSGGQGRKAFAPSIDRKQNEQGYTIGNVQVVCNAYNLGKNNFSESDFVSQCQQVAKKLVVK